MPAQRKPMGAWWTVFAGLIVLAACSQAAPEPTRSGSAGPSLAEQQTQQPAPATVAPTRVPVLETDTAPAPTAVPSAPTPTKAEAPTAALPTPTSTPRTLAPVADWPTEGWQTSTPEEQGVDSAILAEMFRYLPTDPLKGRGMIGILVVRHGHLVLEAYFHPYRADLRTELYSCTKSVTGMLVGLAVKEGFIESVDQPVLSFFPEREIAYRDERKEAMTVEDLLTMRTGMNWMEFGVDPEDPRGVFQRFIRSPDWVQFVLDRPMLHEPGRFFEYSTGASHLLSATIQQATGQTALDFARRYLFGPMGITDVDWFVDAQGVNSGGYGLTMTPPDMAKLGYLALRLGEWDGEQLVPEDWIEASTAVQVPLERYWPNHKAGYGYQWWVFPGFNHYETNSYSAVGYKGQYIFVIPDRDMVVVFSQWEARLQGQPSAQSADEELWYLHRFILYASKSDEPLPPNPEGLSLLQAQIDLAAQPPGP